MPAKPTREELKRLYMVERMPSPAIAPLFGVSARTIRQWMADYGIPLLGPTHLRKGVSAHWNKGRVRTPEEREKNRVAHLGNVPGNYGRGRVRFSCEVCGVEVFDRPYRRKRTCSSQCRNTLMSVLRGEKHWNYKGGEDSAANQRRRGWADYRDWRKAVLKRCKRACAKCGERKRRLTAHHIRNWADHIDLRFDPGNGVVLCWGCHCLFHVEHGQRHTTPEMLEAWLA